MVADGWVEWQREEEMLPGEVYCQMFSMEDGEATDMVEVARYTLEMILREAGYRPAVEVEAESVEEDED